MCCCQIEWRTKALLIGICDLVLGIPGLIAVIMYIVRHGFDQNWEEPWGIYSIILYLPAIFILMGIFKVWIDAYRNQSCLVTAIIFRSIWTVGWTGLTLFVLSGFIFYRGFRSAPVASTMLMIVLAVYSLTQAYFLHVVLEFSKEELKTKEAETKHIFSPVSQSKPRDDKADDPFQV